MASGLPRSLHAMTFSADLIYAARSLQKTPVLAIVIVLTLALGIGVNTTAFNLLNVMVLAPSFGRGSGPVVANRTGERQSNLLLKFPRYGGNQRLHRVGAGVPNQSELAQRRRRGTSAIDAGVRQLLLDYRYLGLDGTDIHGWGSGALSVTPNVVVLSYEFWQNHFGSDHNVLGHTLNLNGRPFTVIACDEARIPRLDGRDVPSNARTDRPGGRIRA